MILLSSIIIDLSLVLKLEVSTSISFVLVLLQPYIQKETIVWGNLKPAMIPSSLVFLMLIGFIVTTSLTISKLILLKDKGYTDFRKHYTDMVSRVSQANLSLQELAFRSAEASRIQERKRIATDLHDTIGHTLVTIKMLIESAKIKLNLNENIEKYLELIKTQSMTGLKDSRSILEVLNQQTSTRTRTLNSIKRLVEIFEESTGVHVHIHYQNISSNLEGNIGYVMYHLIQESLTNSLVHGEAKNVFIQLWVHSDILNVHIKDDGIGCSFFQEGYGLSGMKARLHDINGELFIRSTLSGFSLYARIPYTRP